MDIAISQITIFEFLQQKFKLSEQDAKQVTREIVIYEENVHKAINETISRKFEESKDVLSTKSDIAALEIKMGDIRADMIKWMFLFWLGQIGVLLGAIFAMFKLFFHQ